MIDDVKQHREYLLGLAYRMTGSFVEAEDIVQETFIRWQSVDTENIQSPRAWLTTVASRFALDYLKSAQVSRTDYIGPWLPEPFIHENKTPENEAALDQSLTTALLVILETLSPKERAAFILHDIFNYDFNEVATFIGGTTTNCRKLASRARTKVQKREQREAPRMGAYQALSSAFFSALKSGDVNGLVAVLKDDAAFHSDGGGKASASLEVLQGAEVVAAFLVKRVSPFFNEKMQSKTEIVETFFNGEPGFLLYLNNRPVTAFNFSISDKKIETVFALRNPDKLAVFNRITL